MVSQSARIPFSSTPDTASLLTAANQAVVKTASQPLSSGPQNRPLDSHKVAESEQPWQKITRNPVDRVGVNIVEVCCRKTTRRLKSREFLGLGRCCARSSGGNPRPPGETPNDPDSEATTNHGRSRCSSDRFERDVFHPKLTCASQSRHGFSVTMWLLLLPEGW